MQLGDNIGTSRRSYDKRLAFTLAEIKALPAFRRASYCEIRKRLRLAGFNGSRAMKDIVAKEHHYKTWWLPPMHQQLSDGLVAQINQERAARGEPLLKWRYIYVTDMVSRFMIDDLKLKPRCAVCGSFAPLGQYFDSRIYCKTHKAAIQRLVRRPHFSWEIAEMDFLALTLKKKARA